jgi:prepilin-type N-terminal cleavage/methylation domain-containing protein
MKGHGAGFTLIEVLVALAVGGLVVVAAQRIFAGVGDSSKAIAAARERLDREANARRWLKATLLSLDPPFEGRTDRVAFTAWHLTPGGWFEPAPTSLSLEGDRFIARSGDATLDLADGVSDLALDYLLDPGANAKWVREWISPVSAPLVVRVRIGRCGRGDAACADTLLFLIKERG